MIEGILIGLSTTLSLTNILMVMVGCFAGTIIGMLPGLGPMTAIALMIPITYGFDPSTGLILMAGVYYGAVFIPTFLSFAPGGIHEMVVISVAYNIDPIFVSYHHFLRIFIIVLFLPYLLSKFKKTN